MNRDRLNFFDGDPPKRGPRESKNIDQVQIVYASRTRRGLFRSHVFEWLSGRMVELLSGWAVEWLSGWVIEWLTG